MPTRRGPQRARGAALAGPYAKVIEKLDLTKSKVLNPYCTRVVLRRYKPAALVRQLLADPARRSDDAGAAEAGGIRGRDRRDDRRAQRHQ